MGQGHKALLAGDAHGALHQFRQMSAASSPMQLPALMLMSAQDRIDAAVRAGDPTQALAWVEDLDAFATGTGLPWAAGRGRLRPRPVVRRRRRERGRPGDRAVRDLASPPCGRAIVRTIGLGSSWPTASSCAATSGAWTPEVSSGQALETFEDLHSRPFAERAGQELRASGETARKRDPSTALNLTPMELKVAELVSQGLSNKDVASQCWVSPRTVAFHLRNVFTKTGVTSRGELAHLDLS